MPIFEAREGPTLDGGTRVTRSEPLISSGVSGFGVFSVGGGGGSSRVGARNLSGSSRAAAIFKTEVAKEGAVDGSGFRDGGLGGNFSGPVIRSCIRSGGEGGGEDHGILILSIDLKPANGRTLCVELRCLIRSGFFCRSWMNQAARIIKWIAITENSTTTKLYIVIVKSCSRRPCMSRSWIIGGGSIVARRRPGQIRKLVEAMARRRLIPLSDGGGHSLGSGISHFIGHGTRGGIGGSIGGGSVGGEGGIGGAGPRPGLPL